MMADVQTRPVMASVAPGRPVHRVGNCRGWRNFPLEYSARVPTTCLWMATVANLVPVLRFRKFRANVPLTVVR